MKFSPFTQRVCNLAARPRSLSLRRASPTRNLHFHPLANLLRSLINSYPPHLSSDFYSNTLPPAHSFRTSYFALLIVFLKNPLSRTEVVSTMRLWILALFGLLAGCFASNLNSIGVPPTLEITEGYIRAQADGPFGLSPNDKENFKCSASRPCVDGACCNSDGMSSSDACVNPQGVTKFRSLWLSP